MAENENEIIILTDEEGNDVQFEHLLTFEYGENFYIALLPVEELDNLDMEDGEVLLMRVEDDPDNEDGDIVLPIETEEELEGAWNAFIDLYYEGEECDGVCEGFQQDCEDRQ